MQKVPQVNKKKVKKSFVWNIFTNITLNLLSGSSSTGRQMVDCDFGDILCEEEQWLSTFNEHAQ